MFPFSSAPGEALDDVRRRNGSTSTDDRRVSRSLASFFRA